MEWDKGNVREIVEFINKELLKGRALNSIESEEFGVNERVIHKRLIRSGYKKIDNQYMCDENITEDITRNIIVKKEVKENSNIMCNTTIDMGKLNVLLENMDKIIHLISQEVDNNIIGFKSGKNEVRSLRIDTGLYDAIKLKASKTNESISAIVNKSLEEFLNRE